MTVTASGYARQANELYRTPAWVTEALLRHYPVAGKNVWEPAAGHHDMADVLSGNGADVVTSDIVDYGRRHNGIHDFLKPSMNGRVVALNSDAIITNPPYGKGNRLAVKFARQALTFPTGLVCLLLTSKFDAGKTRVDLFRDNPKFAAKIVLLDRIAWFGEKTGTEDHAWYIWDCSHSGLSNRPARIIYETKVPA